MANVVGEPFSDWVAKQIRLRQELHGKLNRTEEDLILLNSKTSWVKLASGVSLNENELLSKNFTGIGDGIDLARRYVLFGGVSSLNKLDINNKDLTGNLSTTLTQRGINLSKDNVIDPETGTYNINANQLKNGQDFGYVPMPGIISVNVRNLNRGSIKKAEIKIKAYSREQFDILDVLYMRLGYTVLLEWGNSVYKDNGTDKDSDGKFTKMGYTLVEAKDGIFQQPERGEPNQTHSQMLSKISYWRAKKSGNYDALLAKISNFSWTFMPDGTYDITLSLISLGDVIESLKINTTPSYEQKQLTTLLTPGNGDAEPTSIDTGAKNNIISYTMFTIKDIAAKEDITNKNPTIFYSIADIPIGIGNFIIIKNNTLIDPYINKKINVSGIIEAREIANNIQQGTVVENNFQFIDLGDNEVTTKNITTNYWDNYGDSGGVLYISGYTEDSLKNLESSTLESATPTEYGDVVYFKYDNVEEVTIEDSGFYMRLGYLLQIIQNQCIPILKKTKDKKIKDPIINIDYDVEQNKMLCYPNQYSYDPQVCIVRSLIHGNTKTIANLFPQLQEWRKDDKGYAYTMNIYVNFVAIQDAIDGNLDERGDLALYPFLESICTKINESLGGINNLEPVIEEETNTLKIIDGSYTSDIKKDDYIIEMYGYNAKGLNFGGSTTFGKGQSNFVRNVNLKTEITPEYASMITIGATAGGYVKGTDGTMFSKWNKGIIDRFKEDYIPPNKDTQENPDEARDAYYNLILSGDKKMIGYKTGIEGNSRSLDPDIISENVALATEYYKYLHAKSKENNENFSSTIGFIPFNLSLTLDGISGIKIYNKLNVNTSFLPTNYPKSLKFIIKGVNHVLQNSDWETTLETVVTSENLFSDNKESYNYLKDLIYNHIKEAKVSSQGETGPSSSGNSSTSFISGYGEIIGTCIKDTPISKPITRNQNQPSSLAKKIRESLKITGPTSTGFCARAVKNIVKKYWEYHQKDGFLIKNIPTTNQGSTWGKDAKTKTTHEGIIKYGYDKKIEARGLSKTELQSKISQIQPNVGDVMAYWDTSGMTESRQKYGHIQFWDGKNWVSGNVQGSGFVYSGSAPITSCWSLIYLQAPDIQSKIK
jgi:hypothetical protein